MFSDYLSTREHVYKLLKCEAYFLQIVFVISRLHYPRISGIEASSANVLSDHDHRLISISSVDLCFVFAIFVDLR